MIKVNQNLGISGEFRVIVRRADGSIKTDTGIQKNLVLDNAFKNILGENVTTNLGHEKQNSSSINWGCVVGTGNQTPTDTDVSLQNYITKNVSTRDAYDSKENPDTDLHEGYVKVWVGKKYIFDNINNENITELGLISWAGDYYDEGTRYDNAYILMTRALIKGTDGQPIAVTVLQGEILEVIYQINWYIDVTRKTGSFTLTTSKDGVDTNSEFEYFLQPYNIKSRLEVGYRNLTLYYNNNNFFYSYGVKESDDELDANYDLNSVEYQSIDYNGSNIYTVLGSSIKSSGTYFGDKYSENHLSLANESVDFVTKTSNVTYRNGIYSHIHNNGIRAFSFAAYFSHYYPFFSILVVVKNTENGQGIKKNNRQLWEVEVGYTLDRYTE